MSARAGWLLMACLGPACTGFRQVSVDVFRSPQTGEEQLASNIATHRIQTVVCLRGRGQGAAASARAAEGAGVRFWSVPMSATRPPRPETLLELWRVAATAPRPLLVHCRAGVDRTGLACALVVLHDTGDLDAARRQLALVQNGHLSLFATGAMDEVLDDYSPFAATMRFPDWVRDVYTPAFALAAR